MVHRQEVMRIACRYPQSGSTDENKLDEILQKMDEVLKAKTQQDKTLETVLEKLNGLEQVQKQTNKEVEELKKGLNSLETGIQETRVKLESKANVKHVDEISEKLDELENHSKRNNVVIWGLKERAEKGTPLERFLGEELFAKCMKLSGVEVMRAHRTNMAASPALQASRTSTRPRLILYLLRYTDKVRILKAAAKTLKGNEFMGCKIYISDDVSKRMRNRREYLDSFKKRSDVVFAFIPWSVPAQTLYKLSGEDRQKSFKLTDGECDDD